MALSTALPRTTTYPEEPKIYISSATLNLKPSKRTTSLGRAEMLDNFTYEWHTNVTTPPNTPAEKPIKQTTNSTNYQGAKEHSRDLFLPAFTFEEQDDLPTKVDKFMSCERYHSQYNQAMAKKNLTQL